jgi:hypothetical protein
VTGTVAATAAGDGVEEREDIFDGGEDVESKTEYRLESAFFWHC